MIKEINFIESIGQSLGWGDLTYHCLFILFVSLFFAILFFQSGIDKIVSFSDNLNYFKDHFKNTFFKHQVKILLIILTVLECFTGVLFLIVLVGLFWSANNFTLLFSILPTFLLAIVFALITLCSLFLGQRFAKDYAGAVNLGIYFLIALLGLCLPLLYLELL